MLRHHWIDRICCIVLAATIAITCGLMGAVSLGMVEGDHSIGYENRLFDQSKVHTLDIVMNDWDSFLQTCTDEQYAACDVAIDGEHYDNVGIRAKGNTSLSSVRQYGNSRYSFKIEFDHYQNGKTYHGLDKLSLNNLIQDSTFLKDYLAYTLMNRMDASAPLCSFVQINVNGQPWGLYLAVEAVEDSFLMRNYGADHGKLYKPDSLSFGGGGPGNGRNFDMNAFRERFNNAASEETSTPPETPPSFGEDFPMPSMGGFDFGAMPDWGSFDFGSMPDRENFAPGSTPETSAAQNTETQSPSRESFHSRGGFGGGMGSNDVKLQYIDDDPSSYPNIFNSAKTAITEADQHRLIASLKQLSDGENVESAVDIEAVIRYLAVHNFMCNDDSYTGTMVHNYYLYEEDGRLSLLPWDYNLALGTFGMGGFGGDSGATSAVNSPIDSPVTSGDITSRPMIAWIFQKEEYTALYHQVYDEFLSTVFESGWFAEEIERMETLIAPYVQRDTNGFFSFEEFQTGIAALKAFCDLRVQSIRGQLDGTIPSTAEAQRADASALIDASHVNLSDMGSFSMGGGRNAFRRADDSNPQERNFPAVPSFGNTQPSGQLSGMKPSSSSTEEQRSPMNPSVRNPWSFPQQRTKPASSSFAQSSEGQAPMWGSENAFFSRTGFSYADSRSTTEALLWLAISAAILAGAIVFVLRYRSGR